MFESPHGVVLEKTLTTTYPFTYNQIECEVCLAGLEIVADMEVDVLKVFNDSNCMENNKLKNWSYKDVLKKLR